MPRSSSGLVSSWNAVLSGSSGARATTSAKLSFAGAPPAGSPCRLAASMLHIVCTNGGKCKLTTFVAVPRAPRTSSAATTTTIKASCEGRTQMSGDQGYELTSSHASWSGVMVCNAVKAKPRCSGHSQVTQHPNSMDKALCPSICHLAIGSIRRGSRKGPEDRSTMLRKHARLVAEGVVEGEHRAALLAQVLLQLPHRGALQPLLLRGPAKEAVSNTQVMIDKRCRTFVRVQAEVLRDDCGKFLHRARLSPQHARCMRHKH